ncbi:Hint domain-containing protein [Streptomyces sp. AK02-01A]|uniref:Hint domain-containing protein n=1 Tax=Streptomyces sp. AK02-01A TaxID=3028648 RepID=UPI0029A4EF66|nr:Hint domain-containing protein [Streptomyces sp. AK02-01A]MDX3851666.1 Hint domain-containing protein [Streptomyces sp. AK02-01A]
MRKSVPRTGTRLPGLRGAQSGQTAVEYVGLLAVVIAIVGALVATGIGPALADGISTRVCRITGGGDCGGGQDTEAAGDRRGEDGPGDAAATGDPAATGEPAATGDGRTPAQQDYEAALKELQDARAAEKSDADKAAEAARELAKILADELGITDALDCVTKGDMGACTETLINVLLSVIGGAVGKLAAKYGAPWKWKKAVELVRKLKKHGGDLYDGLTGLLKNRKKVGETEDRLADAKRKLDAENKGKPKDDDGRTSDKPPACPVSHSFPSGTPVLLADGGRLPIERVRTGDLVSATDPVTGRTTARKVTDTFVTHADKEFTRLAVRTGSGTALVTATDTHPFWLTDRRRWAAAGDIRPGAALRTERGGSLKVLAARHYTQRRTTYDLEVDGTHTYYVGVGAAVALVHNNDCEWPVADSVQGPAAGKTLKRPNKRHTVSGAAHGEVKPSNTIILRGMEKQVDDDIKAIAEGRARLDPDGNTYRVNGRSYEVKSNGTVFPKDGPGLVNLDRVEYSALQLIAKGDPKSLQQLERNPKFTNNPQAVAKAREIYEGTYK